MPREGGRIAEPPVHARITDWPPEERPREKLMRRGAAGLSDAELLAIIIRSGAGRTTAVEAARRLLVSLGALTHLATRSFQELRIARGIGPAKAVAIVAAFELGRRAAAERRGERLRISSPEDVVRAYQPLQRDLRQEQFTVLLLDSANRLLRDVTVTSGTLNSSLVHPREVFRPAIAEPAAGIILLHNHPSGNPEPSTEDLHVTRQLVEASRIIGIPIHDHIILAGEAYASFAERGLL